MGKTSLIKSIVQTCEDIVHVDPLTSTTPTLQIPSKGSKRVDTESTTHITEIHASTRPYPSWWCDFDDSNVLRRRKSLGDSVLDRNLCFIDTPGYGRGGSAAESIDKVVRYVEGQFERTASLAKMSDGDLMALLGGSGGSQVDVVFFVISRSGSFFPSTTGSG